MVKGVIFDVDGVLLNSMPVWENLGELYLQKFGIQAEKDLSEILYEMSLKEDRKVMENDIYIVKKKISTENFLLKLNRQAHQLEVYKKSDEQALRKNYSIRKDFDPCEYTIYEKIKEMPCLFGREDSPTPYGVFDIVKKSKVKEEYISGYHKKYERIKFFGYLVIFEDYFIHSDLYMDSVTSETFEQAEPISNGETGTTGCIRISQKNVGWLLKNIEVGTTVIL